MSFRLAPKSVTLNDFERRNGRYFGLFQRIRVPGVLSKSSRSLSHLLMSSCIMRLEAGLQPNIGFTLRPVLTAFSRSNITSPKVNRFG